MSWKRNLLLVPMCMIAAVSFTQVSDPGTYSSQSRSSRSGTFGNNSNQNNNSNNNQNNTNNQNSSNNNNNNQRNGAKATPTPRASGTPNRTMTTNKSSTGTKTATPNAPGGFSKAPGGKGPASATGGAWTGQVKEVTRGMIESIKTRKVEYDPEDAADDPNLIILNAPKYKAEDESITLRAGNKDANQSDTIVHPL